MNIKPTDALIVIDPQNDFCPGGALAVSGGDEIMHSINALVSDFKDAGGVVVLTQDYHPKGHKSFASTWYLNPFEHIDMPYGDQTLWPDHCVQGTTGAAFHPVIASGATLRDADMIIRKGMNQEVDSYSAFIENDQVTKTGLAGFLRDHNIKRVILVGLAFDFCVGYSAIDAIGEGFEAVVLKRLTRSIAQRIDENQTTEDAMNRQLAEAGVTVEENLVEA